MRRVYSILRRCVGRFQQKFECEAWLWTLGAEWLREGIKDRKAGMKWLCKGIRIKVWVGEQWEVGMDVLRKDLHDKNVYWGRGSRFYSKGMTCPQGFQKFSRGCVCVLVEGGWLLEGRESKAAVAQMPWLMRTSTWLTDGRERKPNGLTRKPNRPFSGRERARRLMAEGKWRRAQGESAGIDQEEENHKQKQWARRADWEVDGELDAGRVESVTSMGSRRSRKRKVWFRAVV